MSAIRVLPMTYIETNVPARSGMVECVTGLDSSERVLKMCLVRAAVDMADGIIRGLQENVRKSNLGGTIFRVLTSLLLSYHLVFAPRSCHME